MLTSVFRSGEPISRRAGYSLLEILVVLALLGLVATIAGPPVGRWVDQAAQRAALQALDRVLLEQRREAVVSAREIGGMEIEAALRVELGAQWQVQASETVNFSALGYCPGGEMLLQTPNGRTYRRELTRGDCRPR